MKNQSFCDRLATAIILITAVLMLAGLLLFRYEQTRPGRWISVPSPPVDPFSTYRHPLT